MGQGDPIPLKTEITWREYLGIFCLSGFHDTVVLFQVLPEVASETRILVHVVYLGISPRKYQ